VKRTARLRQARIDIRSESNKIAFALNSLQFQWRNDAMMVYDVSKELPKLKVRTLVIGVNSDELFPPEDEFILIAKLIPGAKLFAYDSVFGHLGWALEIKKAGQAIAEFLK
jgi:homoserine O-acetyltransferase